MGLDTSHDCWHGPYTAFHRFRIALAKAAGIPLLLMDNFYERGVSDDAMVWAAPREGGPLCKSHHGPVLHRFVEMVDGAVPVKWESLRPDPLHVLLNHSDCDGEIASADCIPIAERIEALLPDLREDIRADAAQFAAGLREAGAAGENVEFH